MRTLVIDTATEACSCAVLDDGELVAGEYVKLGRGHAERLVPMIAALPYRGRADEIWVNCGPGSFTGIRVGLSAAKALALAWDVPLSGYDSLALVAAIALSQNTGASHVGVAMHGGHGELFVQMFDKDGAPFNDLLSARPQDAAAHIEGAFVAGSGAETLGEVLENAAVLPLWPDARMAYLLPPDLRNLYPEPVYGRAPDATPMVTGPMQI